MTSFDHLPQIALDVPLNPSKGDEGNIRTGLSQCDRRYSDTFFDQHTHPTARYGRFAAGRPFCGPREMAANMDTIPRPPDPFCGGDLSCGQVIKNEYGVTDRMATLSSVWTAPWIPIYKYFKFHYEQKRVRLDYDAMMVDELRGLEDYYRGAAKLGAGMNIMVEPGKVPHGHITTLMGMPSRMAYIAQAAIAKDPWLLGFIDEPNAKLADILGYSHRGLLLPDYESPTAVITPAQVIATPDNTLMALVEQLQAQVAELSAKKATQRANGAKGAAKRHANKVTASPVAVE